MRVFSYGFVRMVSVPALCAAFASAAHAGSLSDGVTSTIVGVNAGNCLGVAGSSSASGAKLQSQVCDGSNYQRWTMNKGSDNYFEIVNVGSGLCADVTDGSTSLGTVLQQWGCSSADYQKWNITDQGNGQYAIISKYNNLAMDVAAASTANGAAVIQYYWASVANQKWTFPDATSSLNGSIVKLVSVNADKCLGVKGSSDATSATLQSQGCSGSDYQSWKLVEDSSGYYELINQGSGQCIDVPYGSSNNGVTMQQWNCSGSDWQKWSLQESGSGKYFIRSKYTGKVLDVAGASTANGATVIQWVAKSSNNDNQLWSMSAAADSSDGGSDTTTVSVAGFGVGTTGGAGGEVVTVTTPAQLTAAVADNTARIIRISGIIDYRNTEGSTTELGCTYSDNYCSYNGKQEKILDWNGYCNGRTLYNVTYDTAGKTPLNIGSNKTLIGIGSSSGIKGKGLLLGNGVSNIIIRNLSITDINDGTIWAGDAITISGASNVWIDHNYIARIGRQFIVAGYDEAEKVTISGNYFDGTTDYGHYCNRRHYWNLLFDGKDQTISLIGNRISMTSGRAPQVNKKTNASWTGGILHMVNNYFDNNYGTAFSTDGSATVLLEGNYYESESDYFVSISSASTSAPLYAPLDSSISATVSTCQSVLGRNCMANYDTNSPSNFVINSSAMSSLQQNSTWLSAVKSVVPMSYSEVKTQTYGPQANITY